MLRPIKSEMGVTLIELLIGVLLGTIVAAGAISVYVMSIQGQTDNIQLVRLNQDLRAMMDIMVRDIRRAGFVTDDPDTYLANLQNNPFFADTTELAIYNGGNCIVYAYNRNNDKPPAVDDNERLGFRLNRSGQLQMRTSGTTNANCDNGSWESITEPEVEITALTFALTSTTLNVSSMATDADTNDCFDGDGDCDGLCDSGEACNTCTRDGGADDPACLTIRNVSITLRGQLRDDNTVTQTINSQVRVRNDKYLPPIP